MRASFQAPCQPREREKRNDINSLSRLGSRWRQQSVPRQVAVCAKFVHCTDDEQSAHMMRNRAPCGRRSGNFRAKNSRDMHPRRLAQRLQPLPLEMKSPFGANGNTGAVMSYLLPSEFVTKMVDAGESKIFMS